MKIETEFHEDHQVKLTVELDPAPFEKAKHQAARKIAKGIKIPGFRPGKAPYGVILRQVGEGAIVEEAIDILIKDIYPKIIEEAEIKPYGPGNLENIVDLAPPTLEFLVPLEAEVELGNYKAISFPYEPPKVSQEDIDKAIEDIREQYATSETVQRPAEEGDIVFIRVSGKRTDVDDKAEATIFEDRFSSAAIQTEEKDTEWPFPGFSQQLIGLSAEDEKTITYQYPEDYKDEELRGAQAEFHVIVTNIQSRSLPEVDDELAKLASDFDTLEELKVDIKAKLEEQALIDYSSDYDNQVIDHLVAESTIKYPPQMIEQEKEDLLKGLEYRFSQQGISKDLYLQIRGIDEKALSDELTPVAEKRVKQALVLLEVAKDAELQVDPEKLQAEAGRTFEAISRSMSPNDAKKFAKSGYMSSLTNSIIADMLTQKAVEYLRAIAKGEPILEENDEPKDESDEAPTEDEAQPEAETAPEIENQKPEDESGEAQPGVEATPEKSQPAPETEQESPEGE